MLPGGGQGGKTGGRSWLAVPIYELSRTALLWVSYVVGFHRIVRLEKWFLGVGVENGTHNFF